MHREKTPASLGKLPVTTASSKCTRKCLLSPRQSMTLDLRKGCIDVSYFHEISRNFRFLLVRVDKVRFMIYDRKSRQRVGRRNPNRDLNTAQWLKVG